MTMAQDIFGVVATCDAPALRVALSEMDRPPSRIRNDEGISLPLFALYGGHSPALEALESYADGFTLHEAAALGHVERLKHCLETAPWALDTLSPDGWTALHLSAFFARHDAVRALLDAGADPDLYGRAFERNLPLHAACAGQLNKPDVVSLLAPVTGDIDARQGGGWTALMLAAANGMADSAAVLLGAGADPRLRNDSGEMARDIAQAQGQSGIVDLLGDA